MPNNNNNNNNNNLHLLSAVKIIFFCKTKIKNEITVLESFFQMINFQIIQNYDYSLNQGLHWPSFSTYIAIEPWQLRNKLYHSQKCWNSPKETNLKRPRFCEGKYWICKNILFVEMKNFKINIIQQTCVQVVKVVWYIGKNSTDFYTWFQVSSQKGKKKGCLTNFIFIISM